ncbi:CshA/CshB family fibrillar adhesin-related protein [Actinomyces sp. MRS3W]|uniref:CshA/CshB family fibrillar adhesin-related protein n=1 Tax=Actinomyces sp. MRS3W TaxID=2800796 RepID=UPI0028FD5F26|nr:CshA/CshB family fibrillar adhesin-related protein [Actinomyces sp. MRS3W]MDU0348891.1 CshA/CshB family fibrillar adhesin-related protein [Actinomyces sp. MRS3W]
MLAQSIARFRKAARRTAVVVACATLAATGMVGASLSVAEAAGTVAEGFATGGEGRFKNDIQWIQWGTKNQVLLTPGVDVPQEVKSTRDLGDAGTLVTTCTIGNLRQWTSEGGSFDSYGYDENKAYVRTGLKAYTPGDWAGDVLDDLYNVGGTGHWNTGNGAPGAFPEQYANDNQMVIGLRNTTDHARLSFDFSCTATLNGQEVPLQGLVFADAEASSTSSGAGPDNQAEWIQAAPASNASNVTWYALDRLRNGCSTDVRITTQSQQNWWDGQYTNFMRMSPNGQECAYANNGNHDRPSSGNGPATVMFMKGATSAGVEIQGRGYTAVALGVVIETDFGDAPESYGTAGALFQPSWTTGTALSNTGWQGQSVWNMTLADITNEPPSTVHLGQRIDSETSQHFSSGADGDDSNGVDDEDALDGSSSIQQGALLPVDVLNGETGTYRVTGVGCGGDGKIQGWIDWNGDGVFSDDEASDTQACPASGSVDLTFTVPQAPVDTNLVNQTVTYLRLRASTNDSESKPTGVTVGGEVEDYLLNLPAQLRLVKEVTNNYGGTAEATDWDLTATAGNTALTYTSGQTRYVDAGSYALAESGTTTIAQDGYEWESLTCTQDTAGATPATAVAGVSKDNPNVTTANATLTVCTFTNADRPGSITWHKVDDSGNDLGGTEWTLTGPNVPDGTTITDCIGSCSNQPWTDQDPEAAHFSLTELPWGTYTLTESAVPDGYQLDEQSHEFTIGPDTEGGLDFNYGDVINERLTGTVTWQKVDADNNKALAGSEWQLTLPGSDEPVTITDCVADTAEACAEAAGSAAYYDADPAAGAFKVAGLAWNEDADYTLAESKAPAGYVLDTTSHSFRILPNALDYSFATAFTNEKTTVPGLPLTGGLGADTFLIGGGVLAALALAAGLVRRRRALNVQS